MSEQVALPMDRPGEENGHRPEHPASQAKSPGALSFTEAYGRFAPAALAAARKFVQAARAEGWHLDPDDAAQVARLALWEVWRRDPACGPGFSTLLEVAVRRRLTNFLRRQVPMIRGASGEDGPRVFSLDALAELEPGWEEHVRWPWGAGESG